MKPNIHPQLEYLRRAESLREYEELLGINIDFSKGYNCREYFEAVLSHQDDRCRHCYALRLRATAREAKRRRSDAFTTTLLYSIYQKHELLKQVGEGIGSEEGIPFLYRDLRTGWQEGCDRYRESGLYRQSYCGCVFSEKERRHAAIAM